MMWKAYPFVFPANLFLFLGREIILDIEHFTYLLGCLSSDHVCHCFAAQIQERLDIEVVCGQDDFKELLAFHLDKVSIPLGNIV